MSSQDLSISGQSRSRHFLPVVRSDICQRRLPGDIGQCPLNNFDMKPKILEYAIYIYTPSLTWWSGYQTIQAGTIHRLTPIPKFHTGRRMPKHQHTLDKNLMSEVLKLVAKIIPPTKLNLRINQSEVGYWEGLIYQSNLLLPINIIKIIFIIFIIFRILKILKTVLLRVLCSPSQRELYQKLIQLYVMGLWSFHLW